MDWDQSADLRPSILLGDYPREVIEQADEFSSEALGVALMRSAGHYGSSVMV
jgi:hypothetical protein